MATVTMLITRILLSLFILVLSFEDFANAEELQGFKLQKARDKCKEYSQLVERDVELLSLIPFQKPTILKAPDCEHPAEYLIVGGKPAIKGEFPHMVAVGFKDENNVTNWNCGGTIISERFVLTAAHCVSSRQGAPVKVRLGTININQTKAYKGDFNIVQIIKHPDYVPRLKYNDIALLKLNKNITFSKTVRPACLWQKHNITTVNGIATGWGLTENAGNKSEKLMKVVLTLYNNKLCQRTYANTRGLRNGIVGNMLCAGVLDGGKDTCNGDSGGPLVITKEDNKCVYYIVGITSFGKSCGTANSPAVYTRVSSYVGWIVNNIWQ